MTITNHTLEQENIAIKEEKIFKVLLTGNESNRKISSNLADEGFVVDFLPMEQPLEDTSANFIFKHFQPGIKYAQKNGHNLILAIDEDTHKIAIAVKNFETGVFQLLNVHQLAAILVYLWQMEFPDDELIFVKSFHITEMVEILAAKGDSRYINVVVEPGVLSTEIAALSEVKRGKHILGFTENQEFFDNKIDFAVIIEKIVKLEEQLSREDKTLFDNILKLYKEFGFYKEKTFVVDFKLQSQKNHVKHLMDECKKNSSFIQERLEITHVLDFKKSKIKNFQTNKESVLNFPSVNMLQIKFSDGLSVSFVPQDQQVYYYFSMKANLSGIDMYQELNKEFDDRIFKVLEILNKL